jgi:hypothetical protein
MAVPAPPTVRPDGVSPSLGLLTRTRAQGPGGPTANRQVWVCRKRPTANWSVLGVSKSLGVAKSLGVSKTGPRALGGPTYWHPPPPLPAGEGLPGRLGAGSEPLVVKIYLWYGPWWCGGGYPPPQVPGYISGPEVDPHCRATARAPGAPRCPARPASPWLPHGRHRGGAPGGGWAAPAPPTNWRALGVSNLWVCRKRPPAPSRPGPGLGLGLPAPVLAPTGQFSGVSLVPRRRLASLAAHDIPPPLPPPTPPPGPRPRRPSPHRQLAGAPGALAAAPQGWLAGSHRPSGHRGSRVARRAPRPRPPARGEGTPARSHRRASRLARGVTSGLPTSHAPAASGPPPQLALQPGAVGPVASRLTIYSPTPFGWGNGEQALKSPEDFPGGALNYVSGLCATFFPYKVGHLLRPVTHFKRTWSKFAHFHVAAYSIPQFRPHRGRSCTHGGSPGRRPTGPTGRQPTGQFWVCRKIGPP